MGQNVELGCVCGKLRGYARGVSPRAVNRVVCYCDDCQAFLHYLGRADLMDAHGGTDIVQVAPSTVVFLHGTERIMAMRLTARGMHRWYADCCKTPLGNTLTPSIPFIGMSLEVFRGASDAESREKLFGKALGAIHGKYAVGEALNASARNDVRLLARTLYRVFGWKLEGKTWPHPFFDRTTRAPRYPVTTLSPEQREALRPKCGPRPHASVADKPLAAAELAEPKPARRHVVLGSGGKAGAVDQADQE